MATTSKDFIVLNPVFNLLETGTADFSGTDNQSITIELAKFTKNNSYIVLTPSENVNVFVSNRTQSSFKINVSQENYQGLVYYHIYRADL
tara:strand:+ start:260 stop:529 length:270 start_codon:yes stop_codon:yes gene_type:complete